jgi:2-aminoadipate transaminase
MDAAEVLKAAVARKVAFVPGESFFTDGTGRNTARLNFSNATPERIGEGVARLAECLRTLMAARPA